MPSTLPRVNLLPLPLWALVLSVLVATSATTGGLSGVATMPSVETMGGTWAPTSTKKKAVATASLPLLLTPSLPNPPRVTSYVLPPPKKRERPGPWAPTSTRKKGVGALPSAGVEGERWIEVLAAPSWLDAVSQ